MEEGDPVQLLFETLSIRRTVKALVEAHDPPRGKDRLALLDHADRDGVVRLFFQGWGVKNKTVWVFEKAHPQSPRSTGTPALPWLIPSVGGSKIEQTFSGCGITSLASTRRQIWSI